MCLFHETCDCDHGFSCWCLKCVDAHRPCCDVWSCVCDQDAVLSFSLVGSSASQPQSSTVSVLSNTSLLAGLGPVEIVSLPSVRRASGESSTAAVASCGVCLCYEPVAAAVV
jgi:hypothetical protein